MKITDLLEAKVGGGAAHLAMEKMIQYFQRKLGIHFYKVPGVEHFHNTTNRGFGVRYILGSTSKCIRFNWTHESRTSKTNEIDSIDIFNGKHPDPSFNINTKGVSFVKILPTVVDILENPSVGRYTVFPVSEVEALTESREFRQAQMLSEAKRDDFTSEEALSDFMKKLIAGRSYTRSDFITSYHITHVGIFDTIFNNFADSFQIDTKRVSLKPGIQIEALKDSILSKAGVIEITIGGTKEFYLKTKQEEETVEEAEPEHVPFGEVLDHLEGLVQGVIRGAFNALFVAGKGGSISEKSEINIKIKS